MISGFTGDKLEVTEAFFEAIENRLPSVWIEEGHDVARTHHEKAGARGVIKILETVTGRDKRPARSQRVYGGRP